MFLEINGIKKHYGEGESRVEVLNGIDIEVNKGEIVVLLGPSGPALVNQHCLILSVVLMMQTRVTYL